MKEFSQLIEKIEQTKSTKEKVFHIRRYFETGSSQDCAWALYFLSGYKLKRIIGPSKLMEWCLEASRLPEWIVYESYAAVGDIAETISLLLPINETRSNLTLSEWITTRLLPLEKIDREKQKLQILSFWNELDRKSIFILNKILTGSLRMGVSYLLTIQALSQALGISKEHLTLKLMGNWTPSFEFFESLKLESVSHAGLNPYPFYLASPIEEPFEKLGPVIDWFGEWKWDGIRAQGIIRENKTALWSRGNELISNQFPEILEALASLENGTVLDGEILAYENKAPLPFLELQKRLGRKKVSQSMRQSIPIVFMIYDILEYQGNDVRKLPFYERRSLIETMFLPPSIKISPLFVFSSWDETRAKRTDAALNLAEGLILKKKDSPYLIGRRKGNWWKYKIDPKTIDAVLIYAQPGNGWRANLYTDFTFGVWHNHILIPIAKAYSGLSMEEIKAMDRWIRKNTLEKYGSVRKVKEEQVFEIAFEGIQPSSRHKSGVALRFPRIARWRQDKQPKDADSLENVLKLMTY